MPDETRIAQLNKNYKHMPNEKRKRNGHDGNQRHTGA